MASVATIALLLGPLAISTTSAAEPAWVEGTESLPPPPTGRAAEKSAARWYAPPILEDQGDVTTLVVTHTVFTRAAGDEEWRSFYGGSWQSEANSRVESADDEMYLQFGIDFTVWSYAEWSSGPNSAQPICNLLSDLTSKVSKLTGDVVTGFTNNAMSGSTHGCAGGNHAVVHLHGSTPAQRATNVWRILRHEYSHFYGAPDRYPDPGNNHTNDVMEDPYNFPQVWCTQAGYNDWGIVNSNRAKYD
jgi:hypothetical protein